MSGTASTNVLFISILLRSIKCSQLLSNSSPQELLQIPSEMHSINWNQEPLLALAGTFFCGVFLPHMRYKNTFLDVLLMIKSSTSFFLDNFRRFRLSRWPYFRSQLHWLVHYQPDSSNCTTLPLRGNRLV